MTSSPWATTTNQTDLQTSYKENLCVVLSIKVMQKKGIRTMFPSLLSGKREDIKDYI